MGFIGDQVESIRSMQVRQVLSQIISLGDARSPFSSHLLRFSFPDLPFASIS
jgi:site-specific recombinase XerD